MLVENSWAGLPCFVSGFDALVSNRAEMWRTNLQPRGVFQVGIAFGLTGALKRGSCCSSDPVYPANSVKLLLLNM